MNPELIKKAYFDFIKSNPDIKDALYKEASMLGQHLGTEMFKEQAANMTKQAEGMPGWILPTATGIAGLGAGYGIAQLMAAKKAKEEEEALAMGAYPAAYGITPEMYAAYSGMPTEYGYYM